MAEARETRAKRERDTIQEEDVILIHARKRRKAVQEALSRSQHGLLEVRYERP